MRGSLFERSWFSGALHRVITMVVLINKKDNNSQDKELVTSVPRFRSNACARSRFNFVPRTCIRATIALSPGLRSFNTPSEKRGPLDAARGFNYVFRFKATNCRAEHLFTGTRSRTRHNSFRETMPTRRVS